ncbi:unnamed protein product [Rhodiola kirilowii]
MIMRHLENVCKSDVHSLPYPSVIKKILLFQDIYKDVGAEKRELIFKEDGQEYAQVLRMLGNGRCEATCIDGTKRLCHIRGKMHKKVWIAAGDIILVGLRDYQDDKADVILKYMPDEARLLKAYKELPENTRLNEGIAGGLVEEDDGDDDDYIEFEDEDIDKI